MDRLDTDRSSGVTTVEATQVRMDLRRAPVLTELGLNLTAQPWRGFDWSNLLAPGSLAWLLPFIPATSITAQLSGDCRWKSSTTTSDVADTRDTGHTQGN